MMAGTPNFGPKQPLEMTTGRLAFSGREKSMMFLYPNRN
jgi:hypothetical protein